MQSVFSEQYNKVLGIKIHDYGIQFICSLRPALSNFKAGHTLHNHRNKHKIFLTDEVFTALKSTCRPIFN